MTTARRYSLLIFIIGWLDVAVMATAARFTAIDYPGATTTYAYGVGTNGDVVGGYYDKAGTEHGFLLHDGVFTSLDYPGAIWTEAYGINSHGDIVGQYGYPADNTTHGFLLRNGVYSPVDLAGPTDLGRANSMPFGVMPDGSIVGCYHQSTSTGAVVAGSMHGFVQNGAGVSFDSANTMNTAVNFAGDVVGYGTGYSTPPGAADHSFLIHDGVVTWFSAPGSTFTRARGIAANGDITGVYQDSATKKFRGFLYRQGSFAPIDVPSATATRPMAMNAIGDIVGWYNDAANAIHGFLLRRTGWWWNPGTPGSGFLMERQGQNMSVTAFVYSWDGSPTWLSASGPMANGTFIAMAHAFTAGQTLTGLYQPAQDGGVQGSLTIQFTDAGGAQLTWVPNPFMQSVLSLRPFAFTGGPGVLGAVENGLWSNPAEPGRLFALEVQDNALFIAGGMFDDGGRATWYISTGTMASPLSYSGDWIQFRSGPTLSGAGGKPLVLNPHSGPLALQFSDAQHGTLTLPDGRQIPIVRMSF